MSGEWIEHNYEWDCPIQNDEQPVQVMWRDGTTTKHRAGAFNWDMVRSYRLLPLPAHAKIGAGSWQ